MITTKKPINKEDGEPVEQESGEKIQTYHEGNRFVFKKGDLEKVWGHPEQEVELVDSIEQIDKENPSSEEGNTLQDGYIETDLGNGQIQRGNLKNGKKDGVWEITDQNGNLWVRENYKEGISHGLSETYYLNSNKKLQGRDIWKEGKLITSETYHKNGQLREKGNYKNNSKEGLWVEYYENGQLREKGEYKNGWIYGLLECFDEQGNLERKEYLYLKQGQKVGFFGRLFSKD